MTTPIYTPMSRADFAAVGILNHCPNNDWGNQFGDPDNYQASKCNDDICSYCNGTLYTGPDITGVLCNREPATTQQEVEAAVGWLGKYGPAFYMLKTLENGDPHTRILHIRPVEAIGMTIDNYGEVLLFSNPPVVHGLLITGGDTPLNPDHVASLIEQADAAGVPVWLNAAWWPGGGNDYFPAGYRLAHAISGGKYRNLPASMMGGKL